MKSFFKKIAIWCCAAFIAVTGLVLVPDTVYAAGNMVTMTSTATSLTPGSTFTVTVGFSSDSTLITAQMDISYASDVLELVSTESVSATGTSSGNPVRVLYDSANGTKSATLVKMKFKVKSGAAVGSTAKIQAAAAFGSDENFNKITLSSASKTITVTAPKSTDATLKSLTISKGTLNPVFNASTVNYTATVENSVSSITVGAVANHSKATVSGTGTKNLSVGKNTITVKVTAESGATKTYTIVVTRKAADKSTDATLKSLTISKGTLNPVFNASTVNYTATVENSASSITIGAVANHSKATVSGTGTKKLSVGKNTITVKVTAESGATKTYTIVVTRKAAASVAPSSSQALSSNNKLKSLTISGITLNFSATRTEYEAKVDNNVSKVTVSAAAQDSTAKVKITLNNKTYGNANNTLRTGKNYIAVTVTAADGSPRTYNIVVTRSAASSSTPSSSDVPPSSEPTSSDVSSDPTSSEPVSSDTSSEPETPSDASSDLPSEPESSDPTSSEVIVDDEPEHPGKDLSGWVIHTAYIGGMIICLLAGCMLGYYLRGRRKD